MAVPQTPKLYGMDKYEVENAAETLIRAKEIELNKPKLYTAAQKLISDKLIAARAAKLEAAKKSVK